MSNSYDPSKFAYKPVEQDHYNNKWYFWDETWSVRHGPYNTEEEAQKELMAYCEWLDSTKPEVTNEQPEVGSDQAK